MNNNNNITFDMQVKFENKEYKKFLKRLMGLSKSFATIGIHRTEGQKPVLRRYYDRKGHVHRAGVSSQFNIAKLAWQNEYGANIDVRTKFFISNKGNIRRKKKQGLLLINKRGEFVTYFPAGSSINIPARRFMRNTIVRPDQANMNKILFYMKEYLLWSNNTLKGAWDSMGREVGFNIVKNIYSAKPPNHSITVQMKGHNQPLRDEDNRLAKNIRVKSYINSKTGTAGEKLDIATANIAEKIYKNNILYIFD